MATEHDVQFKSGSLQLAGTMMLPDSDGHFPGVLLIPGSGPVDRNENAKRLHINSLQEIASHLTEHGIATLRYDKRGVGASEGNFWETGFFNNVSDASAALDYLKSRDQILPESVFLLGHSEGALTATRMAGTGTDVTGVILLAGTARSGEELLQWQIGQVIKGLRGFNRWLINFLHIDVRKAQRKQIEKIKRTERNWYRTQLIVKVNAKWLREFMEYNPVEDLSKIQVPVLAITGSKDIQVDPADLSRMAELVKTEFDGREVLNLTHLLRTEPGEPTLSTYKQQVTQPVDKQVLQIIIEWIKRKTVT